MIIGWDNIGWDFIYIVYPFNSRLMCIMYLTSLLLAELCICATSWPLIEEQGDTLQEMDFFEMFKNDFGKLLSISRASFFYII